MHNTGKKKAERLAREVRRHERKIEALQQANAALLKRALDAEKAGNLLARTVELLSIRVGLAYGEDVMDEERGKSIGKCLKLPVVDANALLEMWQAKARNDDETHTTIIAVGLRDDPDDHKTDAELEAEAAEYQKNGGADNE